MNWFRLISILRNCIGKCIYEINASNFPIKHIIHDIEHQQLLEDDTALESSLHACHTLSLIKSLVKIIDSFPSFVVDSWIEVTQEETFNWEVGDGVNQITKTSYGIKSQIELGCLWFSIACYQPVGHFLEDIITFYEGSNETILDISNGSTEKNELLFNCQCSINAFGVGS